MRIFLTGATGFVGSHLVEVLVDAGHEVECLVRKSSDVEHLEALGVETVEGELGKAAEFEASLGQAEVLIHVAGVTGATGPEEFYRVNAEGTRDLVDRYAARRDEGRVIYVSSVSAQGPSEGAAPRSAEALPRPVSDYGASKLDGEGAVLAHRQTLKTTVLRPPVIYGPRDGDMFDVFRMAKLGLAPRMGGGQRWLSLIYVEDVVSAIVACLEAEGDGEIYPIDDGQVYTWKRLGCEIGEAMGKRSLSFGIPKAAFVAAGVASDAVQGWRGKGATFGLDKVREMSQASWVCGHEAIHRDLGWTPSVPLRQGAAMTADWYRAQGWL